MSKIDKAGMTISSLCAIHCAIVPIAISILPIIGLGFLAQEWFEWTMVSIAAILGVYSLTRGHSKHQKHTAWCFFVPGIILVLTALIAFECVCAHHDVNVYGYDANNSYVVIKTIHQEIFPWRAILMVVGGLLIAASHFINAKLCKTCHECTH